MSDHETEPVRHELAVLNVTADTLVQIEAHPQFQGMSAAQQDAVRQWVSVGVDAGVDAGYQKALHDQRPTPERLSAVLIASAAFLEHTDQEHLLDPRSSVVGQSQILGQGE